MKNDYIAGAMFFCITVCSVAALLSTHLNNIIEKYNTELRQSLTKDFYVDPGWNPNDLLVKGWAPALKNYPAVEMAKPLLHFSDQAVQRMSEPDGVNLPIQPAPLELPISYSRAD